jgi:hypothetical protein
MRIALRSIHESYRKLTETLSVSMRKKTLRERRNSLKKDFTEEKKCKILFFLVELKA